MTGVIALMIAVTVAYMDRTMIAHLVPFFQREALYTTDEISLVLAAFGIGYVIGLPFSGYLIKRLGYKVTLLASMAGWAVSGWVFAFSSSLGGLIFARFTLGVFEAPLFPLFVAWITYSTSPVYRTLWISLVEMCSYIGMALAGPIAVYIAMQSGWRWSYAMVSAFAMLSALVTFVIFKEPRGVHSPKTKNASISRALLNPTVLAIALGFALYNFGKSFYSTWMPSLLIIHYGKTSWEAASISSIQSVIAPAASVLAAGVATLLLRQGWSMFSKMLPMSICFMLGGLISLAAGGPHLISYLTIISFVGLISTSSLIWGSVPDSADKDSVAHYGGFINAVANVGSILGPLAVGNLVKNLPEYATVPVGAASVLSLVLFFFVYRRKNYAS